MSAPEAPPTQVTRATMTTRTTAQPKPGVVLFYKYFIPCPSLLNRYPEHYIEELCRHQRELCAKLQLKGRVLLAIEGINGTLSARSEQVLQEYFSAMDTFDLVRDCTLPENEDGETGDNEGRRLYADIDWKQSTVGSDISEPFPDLKISIVKEIVSTGGIIEAKDLPRLGGRHLSPRDFHDVLTRFDHENVVLIDVRNTFEHEIGHFVHPKTQQAAMNPNMVAFSNFDSTFCAKQAPYLKDKKVLMYCTGGIRCEKASAMLRKRGVDDVYQLKGGIHRYIEEFGDKGFFRGKNFVFDQRVSAMDSSSSSNVVGKCVECAAPFDDISGSRLCTVCRDLVLVCPKCQSSLREYHCRRHSVWKHFYFTFLEVFDVDELRSHKAQLEELRESMNTPGEYKNIRRTLMRQITKVANRLDELESGRAKVDRGAPRRCRTCMKINDMCDGRCWGFWKQASDNELKRKHAESD